MIIAADRSTPFPYHPFQESAWAACWSSQRENLRSTYGVSWLPSRCRPKETSALIRRVCQQHRACWVQQSSRTPSRYARAGSSVVAFSTSLARCNSSMKSWPSSCRLSARDVGPKACMSFRHGVVSGQRPRWPLSSLQPGFLHELFSPSPTRQQSEVNCAQGPD